MPDDRRPSRHTQAVWAGEQRPFQDRATHVPAETLRVLEGAEAATSFATGMAAISDTLVALLSPGDRVVSVKDTYCGTTRVLSDHVQRFDQALAAGAERGPRQAG